MSVALKKIVPFGRSRREYELMFGLTETELQSRILGCGDGPASFNAEMTADGYDVISVDPIYKFSGQEIRHRFEEVVDEIIDQVRRTPENWVWSYHSCADDLKTTRRQVMEKFQDDFTAGKNEGRYVVGELPDIPFNNKEFDLALCSHLLFLYSDQLSTDFHIESVVKLCRVAREVRIFPLLSLDLQISRHLEPVCSQLSSMDIECRIVDVEYELQRGGNQMLQLVAAK